MLKPVIQEETTGCGIASVANVLGKAYSEMKAVANDMGIYAEDKSLWSDTQYVREMLSSAGVETSPDEITFESWGSLPDLALLSIKHHQESGKNFWHWVVFKRIDGQEFVLDSASYLPSNIRTDFDEMHPKWFIEITKNRGNDIYIQQKKDIYGCLPDFKDNDDCRSRTYIRSLYGAILRLTMMRSAPLRLFTHSVFDLCPFRLCRGPETGYVIILCNLVWRAYKSRSFYAAILRTS